MASITQKIIDIEPVEGCIASAMRVLGRKWSALILRDLHRGPKRFCELEHSIEHITPRVLSQRLMDLESQNIIKLESGSYELTSKGYDLIPTLVQMASWGNKYPS